MISYLAIWISVMQTKKTDPESADRKPRADGRKPLLAYLNPLVIKDLKRAALDDDRNTYEIVEEAARDWLARREQASSKSLT